MYKKITTVEELLVDEHFLAWHNKADDMLAQTWQEMIDADRELRQLMEKAIYVKQAIIIDEKVVSAKQVLSAEEKLTRDLFLSEPETAPVVELKKKNTRWWIWAAAASVVLIISVAGFWKSPEKKASLESSFGEISEKVLPDGSAVLLNANSKIFFSDHWNEADDREVWINGEGFFKVVKTPARSRFIVHTDKFDIEVTGTRFNVMNRMDKANVTLTEGSVIIRVPDGKNYTMKPGDYFEINTNGALLTTADPEKALAWQRRKLSFDNVPMSEAVKQIEFLYGVTIRLMGDEVAKKILTGELPNNNLDVLLNALEATESYRVTREKNIITISLKE